jgi:uncharacterized protein (DUF1810 family)
MNADPFDLNRFVTAQASVFDTVLEELKAGRKRTHWMWFVFPQLRGLGRSSTAQFFGISSLAEARAYLAHPVLGPRLVVCAEAILGIPSGSLHGIFGSPDDLKFQSCMTLFEAAAPSGESVFTRALEGLCGGKRDVQTLRLVASMAARGGLSLGK